MHCGSACGYMGRYWYIGDASSIICIINSYGPVIDASTSITAGYVSICAWVR